MKRSQDTVKGIEGENDFSGKRYVWVKDPQAAFVRGWIVEEMDGNRLLVQCDDGTVSIVRYFVSCSFFLTLASKEKSTPRPLIK
jgi:hypothetical protein